MEGDATAGQGRAQHRSRASSTRSGHTSGMVRTSARHAVAHDTGPRMSSIFIAAAIPVFFSLIFLEAMVAYRQGRSVYRFNDAVVDLSCGIGQQMTQVVWAAAVLGVYVAIYEWFAIFEMSSSSAWTWIFAVLAYDHQYYWWHRVAHRSRLFWTTHVVHHHSEVVVLVLDHPRRPPPERGLQPRCGPAAGMVLVLVVDPVLRGAGDPRCAARRLRHRRGQPE